MVERSVGWFRSRTICVRLDLFFSATDRFGSRTTGFWKWATTWRRKFMIMAFNWIQISEDETNICSLNCWNAWNMWRKKSIPRPADDDNLMKRNLKDNSEISKTGERSHEGALFKISNSWVWDRAPVVHSLQFCVKSKIEEYFDGFPRFSKNLQSRWVWFSRISKSEELVQRVDEFSRI